MLTLDGYNNTVALNGSATLNDTDTPLPSWLNSGMLDCVNQTIGAAALLVDADTHFAVPSMNAVLVSTSLLLVLLL